jgi:hypothetical protein
MIVPKITPILKKASELIKKVNFRPINNFSNRLIGCCSPGFQGG